MHFLCAGSAMCLHLRFSHNSYYLTLPYLNTLLPYYTEAYSFTSLVINESLSYIFIHFSDHAELNLLLQSAYQNTKH